MKKIFLFLLLFTINFTSYSQKKEAYQIYTSKGKKVSYKKMMKDLKKAEITFFGELHDDPIAHWLQYEVTKELAVFMSNKLVLGFEMLESDQQLLLDDYLKNLVKERVFEDSCRCWTNYSTDYKPLVLFGKNNSIPCIATNIPRKYASKVFKEGRESLKMLSSEELTTMCPIDFPIDTTLSQYKLLLEMGMHDGANFVAAQAIKDATMAQFIHQNWAIGTHFIHFNGAFHTDFHQGIIWYLKQYRPILNYRSISVVQQENVGEFNKDNLGQAHYIICTPESMTKTH